MFDQDDSDIELSIEELLSWKPPKPTIDIDDIVEIEKFLYGDQLLVESEIDGIMPNVRSCEYDAFDSDDFETDDCSDLSPSFALLDATANSSFEDDISLDEETQIRLEALLEAAGVGKLPVADGKAFADPEVLRRLSSSVTSALGEATTTLTNIKAERKLSNQQNQEQMKLNECQKVTNLISFDGEDDNIKDEKSLLSLACASGYYELVEVLLSVPPYADESTYLTDASSQKLRDKINTDFLSTLNQQLTKVLLSMHADVEESTETENWTPLMEAASGGYTNIVDLLLSHGATINATSNNGNTALFYACKAGHIDVVKILLEHGADLTSRNQDGHSVLMETAISNQVSVASVLLENGATVNGHGKKFHESALTLASKEGHVEMVMCLLQAGADLEYKTKEMYTPLMEASVGGHLEVADLLLDCGAQINKYDDGSDTPLHLAVCEGYLSLAKLLMERGAYLEKVNKEGYTPLMEASRKGHEEMISLICNKGSKVNAITEETQKTALTLACSAGYLDCVKTLLNFGADLELGDYSPLMEATTQHHFEIVKCLCEKGAKVNQTSSDKKHTALSLACQHGDYFIAELLLSKRSNPFQKLQDGSNALVEAARRGHVDIVKLLLDFSIKFDSNISNTSQKLHLTSETVETTSTGNCPVSTKEKLSAKKTFQKCSSLRRHSTGITNSPTAYMNNLSCSVELSHQLVATAKSSTDSEVLATIDAFLHSMRSNSKAVEPHLAKSIVEEAQLKLVELEHLIKGALDRNAFFIKAATIKRDQIGTKDKTKECTEDEVIEKRNVLEELKKVERELQLQACFSSENEQPDRQPETTQSLAFQSNITCDRQQRRRDCKDSPSSTALHMLSSTSPAGGSDLLPSQFCLLVNGCTETNYDTPLSLAVSGNHIDLVRFLISKGADVGHRDKKGFTPFHLAANAGHTDIVSVLLDANADIDVLSSHSQDTPLCLACSSGHEEVAEILLCRGANIELRNESDYTPLSIAASGGCINLAKLLLNYGAEINSRSANTLGISPLMLAVMNGHCKMVRLLLDMGADVDDQAENNRNTALTLACYQGHHDIVNILVEAKANLEHRSKTGLTSLMEAASGGFDKVGRILLDKGADPNAAPVPSTRDTALLIATEKGYYSFCKLLLSRGACVDVKNKKGNTSLWLACNSGNLNIVILLVNKGASLDATDNKNITPLMAAFRKGFVQIVHWLSKRASQFPSDSECLRFIATITDKELLKCAHQCKKLILEEKKVQEQEANKSASKLLKEIDLEKNQVEDRREKAARKREKRRIKRRQKSEKEDNDANESDELICIKNTGEEDSVPRTCKHIINQPSLSTDSASSTPDFQASMLKEKSIAPIPVQPLLPSLFSNAKSNNTFHKPAVSAEEFVFTDSNKNILTPSLEYDRKNIPKEEKSSSMNTERKSNEAIESINCKSVMNSVSYTNATCRSVYDVGKKDAKGQDESTDYRMKRIGVASNLISRVIGRAGFNVNAIRHATGAEIDIEKVKRGDQKRIVSLKGPPGAIYHAQRIITALVAKEKANRALARSKMREQTRASKPETSAKQGLRIPVIAAPTPSQPAWLVPPSILSKSPGEDKAKQFKTSTTSACYEKRLVLSASKPTSKSSFSNCNYKTDVVVTSSAHVGFSKAKLTLSPSNLPSPAVFSTTVGRTRPRPIQPVAPMVSSSARQVISATKNTHIARNHSVAENTSKNQKNLHATLPKSEGLSFSLPNHLKHYSGAKTLPSGQSGPEISTNNPIQSSHGPLVPPRDWISSSNGPDFNFSKVQAINNAFHHSQSRTADAGFLTNRESKKHVSLHSNIQLKSSIQTMASFDNDVAKRGLHYTFSSSQQPPLQTLFSNKFSSAGNPTNSRHELSSSLPINSCRINNPSFATEAPFENTQAFTKPKPIGIERANRRRHLFVSTPDVTDIPPLSDLWSYDRLTPGQIGIYPGKSEFEEITSDQTWNYHQRQIHDNISIASSFPENPQISNYRMQMPTPKQTLPPMFHSLTGTNTFDTMESHQNRRFSDPEFNFAPNNKITSQCNDVAQNLKIYSDFLSKFTKIHQQPPLTPTSLPVYGSGNFRDATITGNQQAMQNVNVMDSNTHQASLFNNRQVNLGSSGVEPTYYSNPYLNHVGSIPNPDCLDGINSFNNDAFVKFSSMMSNSFNQNSSNETRYWAPNVETMNEAVSNSSQFY